MAEVIGYCGTYCGTHHGQIEIFEECFKNYQTPKRTISLLDIRPDPGIQEMRACSTVSSKPSTSPSTAYEGLLWPFQVVLKNGEVFQFFLQSPDDQNRWMRMFVFLHMFPYSPIPKEPDKTVFKHWFRGRFNPGDYEAG